MEGMEANISVQDDLENQLQESTGGVALQVFQLVVMTVTCVLGILGNGLVIWVAGFRMTRTVTTLCYLNLALADFFFTLMMPFLIVSKAKQKQWPFGWILCKFVHIVVDVNLFGSVFLIALIAVDRCVCVLHPIWAQNHRTVGLAAKVLVGPWVLAFLLTLPVIIFVSTLSDPAGRIYCTFNFLSWGKTDVDRLRLFFSVMRARDLVRFLVGFSLPMSSVAICYGLIAAKVHRKDTIKSSRTMRLLTVVVASFFLCWFPFQLVALLTMVYLKEILLEQKYQILEVLADLTSCLAFFNSCLNPLLYVFMGRDFRQTLIHSLPAILERALSEDTTQSNQTSVKPTPVPVQAELQAM